MKKYIVTAAAGLALSGAMSRLSAQGLAQPTCPSGPAQDACQQAYDLFAFMAPQLGLALAGGNATLGQGGVLGGLGHVSVGLRGNVFGGSIPDVSRFQVSATGAQASVLPTNDRLVGLPTADAAIGLYKGVPLPLANILGVDALVSALYVPTISESNLSISPSNSWQFGYGARLGLVSESIVTPGVSVTWIERDLPTATIIGTIGGDTLSVRDAKVKTSAWRVVASKSFIMFGLAAGAGQDTYNESANISATVHSTVAGVPVVATATVPQPPPNITRMNYFLDASFDLPIFKIVAEVGAVSGGSIQTLNSFSGSSADRSLAYGSAGIRLSW
jgi:hypothetical protein